MKVTFEFTRAYEEKHSNRFILRKFKLKKYIIFSDKEFQSKLMLFRFVIIRSWKEALMRIYSSHNAIDFIALLDL